VNDDDNIQPLDPDHPFAKLVEDLQYNDPTIAGARLLQVLHDGYRQERAREQQTAPYQAEITKSRNALNNFVAANSSIARDRKALAAMEREILDQQRRDLLRLTRSGRWGDTYTEAQAMNCPDKDVATWHARARAEGQKGVRDVDTILDSARLAYQAWSGTTLFKDGPDLNARHIADRKAQANARKGIEPKPWEADEDTGMRSERDGSPTDLANETARLMGVGQNQANHQNADADEARFSRGVAQLQRMRNASKEGRVSKQAQQEALAVLKVGG
jgi:hypothetical protein